MIEVLNLALPYFGLIFLGFVSGRVKAIADGGMAWMDFFILYLALPALFYRILAKTPFEELSNVPFIATALASTVLVLAVSCLVVFLFRRDLADSAIGSLAGAYGNIGYMGPGLAIATVGAQAAAPVALIFCFETLVFFSFVPLAIALARPQAGGLQSTTLEAIRRITLHPLMLASALGALSAAIHYEPPSALDTLLQFLQNAAAPCALFALGVTVSAQRVGGMPREVAILIPIKLMLHPILTLTFLIVFGPFDASWVKTAILMAALPPALNVFVLARQYEAWMEPASASVLAGTLISVATLTTVMWLVQSGWIERIL